MMADDTHDTVIHVRCRSGLKREVRVAAAEEGLSLSAYVRQTLRESVSPPEQPEQEQPAD